MKISEVIRKLNGKRLYLFRVGESTLKRVGYDRMKQQLDKVKRLYEIIEIISKKIPVERQYIQRDRYLRIIFEDGVLKVYEPVVINDWIERMEKLLTFAGIDGEIDIDEKELESLFKEVET